MGNLEDIEFDNQTPYILDPSKVGSLMGINKDTGFVGNVAFNLLIEESRKDLIVNGIDLDPADYPPGSSLPTFPLGYKRRIADVKPGIYYWNDGVTNHSYTIAEENKGILFFDGEKNPVRWSLTTQPMPKNTISDEVIPAGEAATSQKAVYKHVQPLYSLYNDEIAYELYAGTHFPGFIGNTGIYNPNPLYDCTDFIPCQEGDLGYYQGQPANNDLPTPAVVGYNGNTFVSVIKNHQFITNNQYSSFQIPSGSGINQYRVSWLKNGKESLKVRNSKYSYKGVSSAAKQLFDKSKEIPDITDFNKFGWYNNRYISNVNGALNGANGWKTLNIPLLNYKDQGFITVSHLAVGGNKYYRFVDKDGLVISFGPASSAIFTLAKPSSAFAFQMVIKVSSEVDAGYADLMVNFGENALPFETFENTPYAVKSIDGNPIIASSTESANKIIDTKKSIAYIGNSITANGVNGSLIGYQLYLNQVFLFTKYTSYGYSGQPFGTFVAPNGATIIEQFIKNATAHDIFVLVCPSTNDFRLSTRLGTFEDYKALTSYGTTTNIVSLNFYQALKAFLIRCYELNPLAKIILSTDIQRDNAVWKDENNVDIPYDSRHPNPVGLYMKDFATAIRTVAEYESLPVVDFFRKGGFNFWTLPVLTSDKLHPINPGYKDMSNLIVPEIKLVI